MDRLAFSKFAVSLVKIFTPLVFTFLIWVGVLGGAYFVHDGTEAPKAFIFYFIACYGTYSFWKLREPRNKWSYIISVTFHVAPLVLSLGFGFVSYFDIYQKQ